MLKLLCLLVLNLALAHNTNVDRSDLVTAMVAEDNKEALRIVNLLLEKNSNDPDLLLKKATILNDMGETSSARKSFDKIATNNNLGSNYNYINWLIIKNELSGMQSTHSQYQGTLDKAFAQLDKILATRPNDSLLDQAEGFLKKYPNEKLAKKISKISKE